MASGTLKWISQLQMTMCAPRCLNLSNYFFLFLFFFFTMVTHLNLLDVFRARGQKSFYIHKGLWITENCIKLSNLITVSTKHNRYLQPYGERWVEEGREQRERNQKCRQCPFIMLMQCMYWRRRLRNVHACVCVCVCVCLSRCRSLTKDLQKAHESFWERLVWFRCYSSLLALMAASLANTLRCTVLHNVPGKNTHLSSHTHTHTH